MKNDYVKRLLFAIISIVTLNVNAQIITDGTYKILNTTLSEVIGVNTIAEGDAGNPQNVIIGRARMQTPDSNNNLQEWTFIHQSNDVYKITNVGDNTNLGVKDGWCGDFGDVQVGFPSTSPYILFKVINGSAPDTYVFQIAFDASCNFGSMNDPIKSFDIDGGNSGSKINTFPFSAANVNQEFKIVNPITLKTNDAFLNKALTIYYKASKGLVINSNRKDIEKLNVTIYDLSGRKIQSSIIVNKNEATIKLNNVSKGVYLANIKDAFNNKLVKKFIVY